MSTWLYQINQESWSPQRYRVEIWEGERWVWPVRKKVRGEGWPKPGDVVVFFYARSGGSDPGFYGWAIVLEWYEESKELYFRPAGPSDQLKMHPWWDQEASNLADAIRGKFKQGTLWSVLEDEAFRLRRGIFAWLQAREFEKEGM